MFTGIVEEIGTLIAKRFGVSSVSLTISASKILEDAKVGDSICVNGVCLTVTSLQKASFTADVMPETLRKTNLGQLHSRNPLNLERAMSLSGRFGGHIVSGHIDGTGVIQGISKEGNASWYTIRTSPDILHYIIPKGSIAIDGISLTVAEVTDTFFRISIIPHTSQNTTLNLKKIGDTVNLENDCIGKYVEKLLGVSKDHPTSIWETLRNG